MVTDFKIDILNTYIRGGLTAEQAAKNLGVSKRTLFRKAAALKESGVNPFIHGNAGRVSERKIPQEQRERILQLYQEKYADLPYVLAVRYLKKDYGICVSDETLRRIVVEAEKVENKTIKINPHPLRRRRSAFGELIQIDGSPHHWFGEDKDSVTLLAFIDDATGRITAARFEAVEDSSGYRRVIFEHVSKYGIPLAFYSDQHSVFKTWKDFPEGNTQLTQYQRICHRLGIETIYALSPQAKGRIERLNRTLQRRWPGQFRLAGIDTIEKANKALPALIEEFNKEFGIDPADPLDAHLPMEDTKQLEMICAEWHDRVISKAKNFSWANKRIQLDVSEENQFLIGKTANLVLYDDGRMEVYVHKKNLPSALTKLRFRVFDRQQQFEIKEYVETTKTIDARIKQIIESPKPENGFVDGMQKWGEKRKELKKKREETAKAANRLTEKVAASKQ